MRSSAIQLFFYGISLHFKQAKPFSFDLFNSVQFEIGSQDKNPFNVVIMQSIPMEILIAWNYLNFSIQIESLQIHAILENVNNFDFFAHPLRYFKW